MENECLKIVYETPRLEIIVIEVEKGFSSSNVENPVESEESEW